MMNGVTKMYKMQPVIDHDLKINLPSCMFQMRNVHSREKEVGTKITEGRIPTSYENMDTFDQNNQDMSQAMQLALRQNEILRQLSDLKEQMSDLRKSLKIGSKVLTSKSNGKIELDVGELVINASPGYPPYFLSILQMLLINEVHLDIKSHVHSSISKLSEDVVDFLARLETNVAKGVNDRTVIIRLIWKEVGTQTELIVSKQPILGEVNILRYISRIVPCLNYDNTCPHDMDSVLDACYLLIMAKTKTERQNLLKSISKKLGKKGWFCEREEISVVDLAVYSTIKQIPFAELNVTLAKWLEKCENTYSV